MCLIHFVINISQKCTSSADVWKYRDSVLGHEACLAANSKSMGLPQKSADDWNCSVDSMVRPTSAEWQNADVDGQWLAVSVQLSIKYSGAVPWRHRYMSTVNLNRTRLVTSSQWSSSCINRDKPLSYFGVSLTTRAAEFITLCNLSVMTLSDSASTALQ